MDRAFLGIGTQGGKYEKDGVENMRKRNGDKTKKYPSLLPRRRNSCGQRLDCVVSLIRKRKG